MNFIFQMVINIFEIFLNMLGFNTQHNTNLREPIQRLELPDDYTKEQFDDVLGQAGMYLQDYKKNPIPQQLVDCFRPDLGSNNWDYHVLFEYEPISALSLTVSSSGGKSSELATSLTFAISEKAVFLPDFVSEFIQRTMNIHTYDLLYTTILREWQFYLYSIIFIFTTLNGVYIFMQMCLFINPYRYPYVLLTELMLPWNQFFEDVCPAFFGYNTGQLVSQVVLMTGLDFVRDVVFTMPFLPSEGILYTAAANANDIVPVGEKFYLFNGIPKLWAEHGVPIDLRTDWFDQGNFQIMKFYDEVYSYEYWKLDYLPMDVPRLRYLAHNSDIDPNSIKRMYKNIAEYITSTGIKGQELKQAIKEILEGKYVFR